MHWRSLRRRTSVSPAWNGRPSDGCYRQDVGRDYHGHQDGRQGGARGRDDGYAAAENRKPDGAGNSPRNGAGNSLVARRQRQSAPANREQKLIRSRQIQTRRYLRRILLGIVRKETPARKAVAAAA